MKLTILPTSVIALCTMFVSCTEKTEVALKVLRDKAENNLVAIAGEAEVAQEMCMKQYATLKERLVKMYTIRNSFKEQLDEAYASNNGRKIQLYEQQLKYVCNKIPDAEKALKEFYTVYQNQKLELQAIKDEIAAYKATGMLNDNLTITNEYDKRADVIKDLTNSLKLHAKRAQSIMEVGALEDTFKTQ